MQVMSVFVTVLYFWCSRASFKEQFWSKNYSLSLFLCVTSSLRLPGNSGPPDWINWIGFQWPQLLALESTQVKCQVRHDMIPFHSARVRNRPLGMLSRPWWATACLQQFSIFTSKAVVQWLVYIVKWVAEIENKIKMLQLTFQLWSEICTRRERRHRTRSQT